MQSTLPERKYVIETYAIFYNVDKSILGINSFVERFGYRFECVNLETLEKSFFTLLSFPQNFKSEVQVNLKDVNATISHEFYRALLKGYVFGFNAIIDGEVILLKAIEDFELSVKNNSFDTTFAIQVAAKLQSFIDSLIQQLKLFKNGDICCPGEFQIMKDNRHILTNSSRKLPSRTSQFYTLSKSDAEVIITNFKETFSSNDLTKLALSSFNLSYEIADLKTKFITLMTCLESLFNQGQDQITHTISRHLSLIISSSIEEFQSNYYRTKALYKLRSSIVHGSKPKESLYGATNKLQDKVRQAINYCLKLSLTKEQLFDKLNRSGLDNLEK